MPNWVKTIVKTKPETLKDIMNKYSEDNEFSFNKVIPMPKDLEIEAGSRGEQGLMFLFADSNDDLLKIKINKAFKDLNLFHPDIYRDSRFEKIEDNLEKYRNDSEFKECIELGKKYISNFEKYGHCNWYEWCVENWGTKWDVSSFQRSKDTMIYQTAWGFAGDVILKLSEKYPDSIFECKFANEDHGDTSGVVSIQNGDVIAERYDLSEDEIEDIWNTYIDDSGQEKLYENEELEIDY